jgi:hypothetical protein
MLQELKMNICIYPLTQIRAISYYMTGGRPTTQNHNCLDYNQNLVTSSGGDQRKDRLTD